ncbi:MAG: cytochrome c [Salaquimonas sp.]
MKRCFVALSSIIWLSVPALAADLENGKNLARKCSVCHGKFGIAKDPEVANLAGQSAFYLEKSLVDFREGKREDRRMSLIVANLSDSEIKDLAAWFSSIEITLVEPK